MPIYLDRDITGVGQDDLVGGNSVIYVQIHVTSVGDGARLVDFSVVDHYLRIGFLALGGNLLLSGSPVIGWRDPIWINFTDQLWTPIPSATGTTALTVVAEHVRWAMTGGGHAHITVYGA